jgi:broad specificity phosphatase PhoE
MKVAFLRHGPTSWNAEGRIQGHTDIPLSDAGLAKMQGLRLPDEFAGARLYCSPLTRARQTVEALGLLDPVLDTRLMEQHWGEWEGLTNAEIRARDGEDCFARAGLAHNFRPFGGESAAELMARVQDFLTDIAAAPRDTVAVAHLGVMRAAYTLATGWTMDTIMPADLDVSQILVLTLDSVGRPSLKELNVPFIVQDGHDRSL